MVPGFPRLKESYDFAVIGGGHAGLQAGLKAALLNYTAIVVDRGPKYSRSYDAPKMDNIPGFPEGISGHKLLDLQIAALRTVEEKVSYFTPARATAARSSETGWEVTFDWLKQTQVARGRVLILAMGVVDRMPVVEGKIDQIFPWANFGIVDFCIFCDGHTLPNKSVAVLGHDAFAAHTAIDLLHFGPRSLELLTNGASLLSDLEEPGARSCGTNSFEHRSPGSKRRSWASMGFGPRNSMSNFKMGRFDPMTKASPGSGGMT